MNTFQEDEAHLGGGRESATREGHLARGVVRALCHQMVVLQWKGGRNDLTADDILEHSLSGRFNARAHGLCKSRGFLPLREAINPVEED